MKSLELLSRLEPETKEEEEILEAIEQDLLTLKAIKMYWLNKDIPEKVAIEHITELLFSNKLWVKEENNGN